MKAKHWLLTTMPGIALTAVVFAGAWLPAGPLQAESAAPSPPIGIEEHLGRRIPLSLTFRDEEGRLVSLGSIVNKPTVLSLVYFSCPGICTPLLNGEMEALDKLPLSPGKDYQAVTVSFNERDTPKMAKQKRANYLELFRKPFPADSWRFLTGDKESIARLTDAVGFRYKQEGNDYIHSAAIYVLSPDGKIARYLYGTSFQPFDMQLAITEASKGHTGPTINKMLLYCFSYDPEGRRYFLNVTRIAGVAVILIALTVVATMAAITRKRPASDDGAER